MLHVLQQLRLEGCEPAILLRTLQRELLLLVTLKRQATHTPLRSLFDKHRVWQNRRQLLSDALTRLSGEQLRQAVTLLTRAELTFKQDYGHDVSVSYTHLRAHETRHDLVCRLLLEKKNT